MKERILPASIIALGLVVSAFLWGGRYTMERDSDNIVWRLDRYSGELWACGVAVDKDDVAGCGKMTEGGKLAINSN